MARDLFGGFQIGFERGVFDVGAARRTRAVDVHGNQGFGVVNHDGAAGWQRYGTRIGGFDLVLDLEARIQRNVVGVAFHAVRVVRHDHAHERLRLFKNILRINQDFADIRLEIVTNRANHQ